MKKKKRANIDLVWFNPCMSVTLLATWSGWCAVHVFLFLFLFCFLLWYIFNNKKIMLSDLHNKFNVEIYLELAEMRPLKFAKFQSLLRSTHVWITLTLF